MIKFVTKQFLYRCNKFLFARLFLFFFAFSHFTFHVSQLKAQQPTEQWVRRFSGLQTNYGSTGKSVKLDSFGNVFVLVGAATDSTLGDYGLLKYNPAGTLLWSKFYNSPGNLSDQSIAFAVRPGGDVYITGNSDSISADHILTVKYNTNGELQWARSFYNAGSSDITLDNNGNIIIIGGASAGINTGAAFTLKYNSNGDTLWTRMFTELSFVNYNEKVIIDDSNNVYTCGYYRERDYLILKYSQNGDFRWYQTYNSPQNNSDIADFIAVDSNRTVYVVGTNYVPPNLFNNTLIKINSNGQIL